MSREHLLIAGIPLFGSLAPDEQLLLVSLVRFRRYRPREVVVREGEADGGLFAVISGFLKAVSSEADGNEVVLSIMGKGEVFGELSVLDGQPRSASVVALEESEVAVIDRAPLLELLASCPALAISMLGVLAQRVRALTTRCEHLTSMSVGGRLAKTLLSLAKTHGEPSGSTVRIRVRLSQQELGSMVGATRESINKLMRSWSETGVLTRESGRVVIRDVRALNSMMLDRAST
jgi:CRP/FNR family cyclic AMP-dependent transcriptional regulator